MKEQPNRINEKIKGLKEVTIDEITIQLDLPQLFEFYKDLKKINPTANSKIPASWISVLR